MAEVIELQKLKLAELRQECEARGLDTKGNKGELIARLQAYLEEHGENKKEEDVDVDDVLGEDTEELKEENANDEKAEKESESTENEDQAEKKVVKISPLSTATERLQKRAERFSMPASSESKKAIRAARFGLPNEASTPSPGSTDGVANSKAPVSSDQLKKRAERFGMNVSSISQKIEEDEKLKKRKERFGGLAATATAGGPEVEAKKMKRAERFGIV
ncbi:SAP domain-containing ribonucleoprotein isoform X1 [Scomber japonicus]|uniref:SAP domain-containing ribonucleoprotein isoform X1 n=1 Tax=Scomber japonicus TaxID=13676 RepID=UPI002306CBC5|nr:SAP domain-containing ribonucleoprotein isoform X1 [Scomber japonicus]